MASVSEDIRQHLVDESIGASGGVLAWSIWVESEPVSTSSVVAHQVITIYSQPGLGNVGHRSSTQKGVDQPSVHIRIRGAVAKTPAARETESSATHTKAVAIKQVIQEIANQTINSRFWQFAKMNGDITFLFWDKGSRPIWTMNVRCMRDAD